MRETWGLRLLLATAIVHLALSGGARAQSILTIAGGGTDDGRPATRAGLHDPFGVLVDPAGNILIADFNNRRVRRVDGRTGLISSIAGNGAESYSGDGGPAKRAGLATPAALALDRAGNLYIADQYSNRVRRVDAANGIITTVAGTGERGFSGDGGPGTLAWLSHPTGLALDADGGILIADRGNNRIRRLDLGTGILTTVTGDGTTAGGGDGGPASRGQVNYPTGVTVDAAGNVFVADFGNQKVRRIDRATGLIRTVAGSGAKGATGDGGPATGASFDGPYAVAVDASGNIFVGDYFNSRVRKVIASTGTIVTFAGGAQAGFSGDAGPASQALLHGSSGVAFDGAGALLIVDTFNQRIRKVTPDGTITTVVGSGSIGFRGDGGPATATSLSVPCTAVPDGRGAVYIAELTGDRVRAVDSGGTISTVAGTGKRGFAGDGGLATDAELNQPAGLARDAAGNLYIVDRVNQRIRKVDAVTGIIRTVAGTGQAGFNGDAIPATAASLNSPHGAAVDRAGNLLVADGFNNRLRRVDAVTGQVSTIAGTGVAGFGGDLGPASLAQLTEPTGVAIDGAGNVFIADYGNRRIRRIDAASSVIQTVAGSGRAGFGGDGGPATEADLNTPIGIAVDGAGNLAIADRTTNRIRRVDAASRLISTVTGTGIPEFAGDGGPAAAAAVNNPFGVGFDGEGTLWVADSNNNRVRAVTSCRGVATPALLAPADGASVPTSVTLSWSAAKGAARYDVLLSSDGAPETAAASDLTSPSATLANLSPGKRYSWKVVAKGDPFCPVVSTASSDVRSFTTAAGCAAPGSFALSSPADGATGIASAVALSWQPASGAGSYDVSLGSSNPPPLAASGVTATSTSATGLTAGATYYWSVTARASCDPTKTTSVPVRSFTVEGSCLAPGSFVPQSPANGATGVASDPTLAWSASPNASSYDLSLGTTTSPRLYLADVSKTSVQISGLASGATYFWKVVAKTSCNAALTSTFAVQSFTVAGTCNAPGGPTIAFVPPGNVGVGQTYVVAWTDAPGLDPGGGYVIERSANASFSPVLDSQTTTATTASFASDSEGTLYHRVRALPACNPTKAGPWSATRSVPVVAGTPDVIFTVQPSAVVTALGEKIDDNKKTSFTLENIGKNEITLQLGQQFLGKTAFFTIEDPLGGSVYGITLEPRKPKAFDLKFQGVDTGASGSYQGVVIVLQANYQPLAIAPFAFVNLKVGGAETAVPSFEVGGVPTEYAFFPGAPGDRPTRTLSVDVVNAGSSPMDLAAEIGPEIWLAPQAGWNSIPIVPRSKRTVTFTTDRTRAPNGSALPRYTYFTVRTKDGRTARLLVQDNGPSDLGQGRTSQLSPRVRSYVVPSVVRATSKIQNSFVTKLRLSNAGSEKIQADLFYTPRDVDGYSGEVRRATVLVPANDVVTLTNPLVQLYGFPPDANVSGQLEVRAAPERIGSLTVTSSVDAPAKTGGTFGFQMPTASRGEGARVGQPHAISGITFTSSYRTNLILAETTGIDHAAVRATLYDKDGIRKGDALLDVPRYGQKQVAVTDLGAADGLEAGQIELAVESGGGAAVGLVTIIDNTNDDAVTYVGRPAAGSSGTAQAPNLIARLAPPLAWAKAAATLKLVVPAVVNGYSTFRDSPLPYTFQSLMGFSSGNQSPATFRLTYKDLNTGESIPRTVTVPGRSTREYQNVLEELFGIPKGQKSQGPVFVEADANGSMYCKVFSILESGTLGDGFPVVPVPAESLTGKSSAKPIYVDGLEQSVDTGRGTRSNLILNEVTGLASATVLVQLYEPGNRSTPIAQQEVSLAAGEKKQLSTVFSGLGLESAERNKDRTNVLCVVTATTGSGLVSAVVTTIDNKTGDTKNSLLTPTGGISASGGGTIGF